MTLGRPLDLNARLPSVLPLEACGNTKFSGSILEPRETAKKRWERGLCLTLSALVHLNIISVLCHNHTLLVISCSGSEMEAKHTSFLLSAFIPILFPPDFLSLATKNAFPSPFCGRGMSPPPLAIWTCSWGYLKLEGLYGGGWTLLRKENASRGLPKISPEQLNKYLWSNYFVLDYGEQNRWDSCPLMSIHPWAFYRKDAYAKAWRYMHKDKNIIFRVNWNVHQ